MRMITLFLPEKYLEMLDSLVASNMYPNRSEALRMAAWKFIHESVSMLKASNDAQDEVNSVEQILDEIEKDAESEHVYS